MGETGGARGGDYKNVVGKRPLGMSRRRGEDTVNGSLW